MEYPPPEQQQCLQHPTRHQTSHILFLKRHHQLAYSSMLSIPQVMHTYQYVSPEELITFLNKPALVIIGVRELEFDFV